MTTRILIAEDEPDLLQVVQYLLEQEGYEVTTATNGNEALRLARVHRPQLAVLDVLMPGLNGFQVCQRLRKDPATENIYVLFLTAKGTAADKETGFRVGADDYLTKPFTPSEFLARVRAMLARAQRLERRMTQIKESFVSIVAHELRTPLSNIKGFGDLLQEALSGELDPQERFLLDRLLGSTRRMEETVNEIVDMAYLTTNGLTEQQDQLVDLKQLIRDAVQQVATLAQKQEISISTDYPADGGRLWVQGNARMLHAALTQLLKNAIVFNRQGGAVRVVVDLDAEFVQVSVHDTGIGMTDQEIQRLFEPFDQAQHYLTREHGGLGLGLALTQRIVERHGGTIWAESVPHQGSIFSFRLPLVADTGLEKE